MSASWQNPVKGKPASESTLNTSGDFDRFTGVMRRLMQVRPEDMRDPSSPSAPDLDDAYTDRPASEPNGLRQP